MLQTLRIWARTLKSEIAVLYFAMRDPRTPPAAKLIAVLVVAYALSPIDLIPDFIPVLGLLDDLILLPIGIALALKLVPPGVLADARLSAKAALEQPRRYMATATTVAIVAIWLAVAALAGLLIYSYVSG
jgi:uncharacterized membrane protein YkvA (DUF1232 family)